MRNILIIIMMLLYSPNLFSQTEKYVGNYENKTGSEDGIIVEYQLSLYSDSTFLFHFFQDQNCYSDDYKAKGKWTVRNDTITFYVIKNYDSNKTINFDFDKTKAMFSKGIIKIYDCSASWINAIKLSKK